MRWTRPVLAFAGGTRPASAAPQQQFSYSFGEKQERLYVPLTSYCNSHTLPVTRGPNFLVPPELVAALCRVRDAEDAKEQWKPWCMWLDMQESALKMPMPNESQYIKEIEEEKDDRRPTVNELVAEVAAHLDQKKKLLALPDFKGWNIVISGEGEPTLRLSALISLVERLKAMLVEPNHGCVRITTNGLLSEAKRDQLFQVCSSDQVSLSVALLTHDASQYNELMNPIIESTVAAHDLVQDFVRAAVAAGLPVEITAIDRPDVDKKPTEQLAASLGAAGPVRWRKYFP